MELQHKTGTPGVFSPPQQALFWDELGTYILLTLDSSGIIVTEGPVFSTYGESFTIPQGATIFTLNHDPEELQGPYDVIIEDGKLSIEELSQLSDHIASSLDLR